MPNGLVTDLVVQPSRKASTDQANAALKAAAEGALKGYLTRQTR